MKKTSFNLLYTLIILIVCSCQSEKQVSVYKVKKTDALLAKQNKKEKKSGLNWTAPNNWIEKKPTDFRLASYDIKTLKGDLVDLSITVFPGDAGGIESNVNRWRRQINLSPLSLDEIMNEALIESSMLGEYYVFNLTNQNNNQGMLATIIPNYSNSGSIKETIFVKMINSLQVLEELKYEFELFCKSIHQLN